MKGIILAGGKGTRLYPVTLETPKPLITIREKPLLNFSIELFARHGVDDIKIIIRSTDKDHYDRWHAQYAVGFPGTKVSFLEESKPMGTLGYIFRQLSGWIGDEEVFVANGDGIIKGLDLEEALSFHRKVNAEATIALMKVEDAADYGAVLVKEDKVSEFLEKKEGLGAGWVSAGLYIISAAALARIKDRVPADQELVMFEKDLFPVLAKAGSLGAFTSQGKFYDCGTFERWEQSIREA